MLTDLEFMLVVSLDPALFYLLLQLFSTDKEVDSAWSRYLESLTRKKHVKSRKRGNK